MGTSNAEDFYNSIIMPDILSLHQEIVEKLNGFPEIKSIYNGWKVWYSPIIDNPQILFIGINPGQEYGEEADVKPDGQLQYIYDQNKRWRLKNDTMFVFNDERLSSKVDLEECVKTNYYYLATSKFVKKEFYKLVDCLGRQDDKKGLGDRFLIKSKEWTMQIIQILSPKMIICEGVSAFDLVTEYALGNKVVRPNKDVYSYFDKNNNISIVTYRRSSRAAGIKDKEQLIKCLEEIL